MDKIALITDTAADLNREIIEKYDIKVLPFRILYKDKEFLDRVDITPQEVYDKMEYEVPTTSLPCLKDMEGLFKSLEMEGYTHAIAVLLSSGLSGIWNAVRLVSENYPAITTYVYDSKSISMGEGVIVETIAELIHKGESFEEIVHRIPSIKERLHLYFVIGTLEYLKRGGRIGVITATFAELLNLKPIVSINEEGKYYTHSKVRGRSQSLTRLSDIAKKILDEKRCRVFIRQGGALEEGTKVYNEFSKYHNVTDISIGDISPVACVHSGPGLVGIAMLEEV